MKNKLLFILLSFLMFSCNKEIKFTDLVKKENLTFLDDKLFTGVALNTTEKGQKILEASFKSGKEDGLWQEWYENEKPKSKINYIDGSKDGSSIEYYENGKTKEEGTYKSGKRNGLWKLYHENGKLALEGKFIDGIEDGVLTAYKEDGHKYKEISLKNGNFNGKYIVYYPNGQIDSVGNYKNGEKDSTWLSYKEDGSLNKKAHYVNGKVIEENALDKLLVGCWQVINDPNLNTPFGMMECYFCFEANKHFNIITKASWKAEPDISNDKWSIRNDNTFAYARIVARILTKDKNYLRYRTSQNTIVELVRIK